MPRRYSSSTSGMYGIPGRRLCRPNKKTRCSRNSSSSWHPSLVNNRRPGDAGRLDAHFESDAVRHLARFVAWSAILSITITALGFRMRDFIRAFGVLYLLSLGIFALGQWAHAVSDNLE